MIIVDEGSSLVFIIDEYSEQETVKQVKRLISNAVDKHSDKSEFVLTKLESKIISEYKKQARG